MWIYSDIFDGKNQFTGKPIENEAMIKRVNQIMMIDATNYVQYQLNGYSTSVYCKNKMSLLLNDRMKVSTDDE